MLIKRQVLLSSLVLSVLVHLLDVHSTQAALMNGGYEKTEFVSNILKEYGFYMFGAMKSIGVFTMVVLSAVLVRLPYGDISLLTINLLNIVYMSPIVVSNYHIGYT